MTRVPTRTKPLTAAINGCGEYSNSVVTPPDTASNSAAVNSRISLVSLRVHDQSPLVSKLRRTFPPFNVKTFGAQLCPNAVITVTITAISLELFAGLPIGWRAPRLSL